MPVLSHPFLRDGIEARGYQIAATQACIRCSTLLVMPTGFGKTAVQWNCIADALESGVEKIVITAPTVGLVEQQRRMIKIYWTRPDHLLFEFDLIDKAH